MPTVNIEREELLRKLSPEINSDEKLELICFRYGLEIDSVVEMPDSKTKNKTKTVYKIEVPANRYDLLSIEGISHAFKVYIGKESVPKYPKFSKENEMNYKIFVKKEVKQVRPIIMAAVIKNLNLNPSAIDSLIEFQERLHFNIGRQRSLVSIGIHDLDKITFPLIYDAEKPEEISFIALGEIKENNAKSLFEEYNQRAQCSLAPYTKLLEGFEKIPVLKDSKGKVCSLPPIINGDYTRLNQSTKNILIEVTATDKTKAEITLNVLCSSLSQSSLNGPNGIDCVSVITKNTESANQKEIEERYPNLRKRRMSLSVKYINKGIGINLTKAEISLLLGRMQLKTITTENNLLSKDLIEIKIPPTRSDILHPCDVMEEVAIAYGFDKIPKTLPILKTIGRQLPLNKLCDKVRSVMSQCSFTEILSWILTSKKDNFEKMKIKDMNDAVVILNPKTKDFEICRTSILPCLLKSVSFNLDKTTLPMKIFEVGDVVLSTNDRNGSKTKINQINTNNTGTNITPTGTKNIRFLSALYLSKSTESFEFINGIMDRIMVSFGIEFKGDNKDNGENTENDVKSWFYSLRESNYEYFFKGRQADLIIERGDESFVSGKIGIMHPEVCENFNEKIIMKGLLVSSFEINLEAILKFSALY